MRAWLLLLAGCAVEANGPCGAPIQVQAHPQDVVVLDDESGVLLESQDVPATGSVTFARPACTNSVTVIASELSDNEPWALSVTDVRPGDELDLVVAHYMPETYDVTLGFQYPAFQGSDQTYTLVDAPGCEFADSPATCFERPKSFFGRVERYGTADLLGYALVPVGADPANHVDAMATIDAWRTDFASLPITVANVRPGWTTGINVDLHAGFDTYPGGVGAAPGTITTIPQIGDGFTVWTIEAQGNTFNEDIVLDSFDALPASESVDFATVPRVESFQADGPTTISWTADAAPADVVRACASWTDLKLSWCVLSPPDRRSSTLPALTNLSAPTTMPATMSVMMMETSRAASYDDIRRHPIASLALPFEGLPSVEAPEVTVRASRLGDPNELWSGF